MSTKRQRLVKGSVDVRGSVLGEKTGKREEAGEKDIHPEDKGLSLCLSLLSLCLCLSFEHVDSSFGVSLTPFHTISHVRLVAHVQKASVPLRWKVDCLYPLSGRSEKERYVYPSMFPLRHFFLFFFRSITCSSAC